MNQRLGNDEAVTATALSKASAHYRLGDFEQCRDLLEAMAAPFPPGFHTLLGLCAGMQGDYACAIAALEAALAHEPADERLPAALLSARLAAGDAPEPSSASDGALGALSGAAEWRRGQVLLEQGKPREAGHAFARAADLFLAVSPPSVAGERLAACCLGQAIAYLAADQVDAAQQAFSRARSRLPPSGQVLARQVFELGEAIRSLRGAEKGDAVAPLVELLSRAHLRVGFYDGSRAVSLHWEGLPG